MDKITGTSISDRGEKKPSVFVRVWRFYYNGFKEMTVGKTLWIIILIKLFIMFAILKVFFFPDFIKGKGDKDAQTQYVTEQLTLLDSSTENQHNSK